MTDTSPAPGFVLPERPAAQRERSVAAWMAPVTIPTYEVPPPDPNPMFLEKRVYQGSSGRVYPNPFTDRLSDDRVDHAWNAVHLENRYLRLMVLPEIGGRIHVGLDRTNGYDFFYRQNVIKPALVGLLGPWISGGVEFNWPQHHRPSTYAPVDWSIEEHADGSVTVWCSEHEPMDRMKGMHGITVHPDSALVEVRVRLAGEDFDAVTERDELAAEVPDVDALAAAVRLRPVRQERYPHRRDPSLHPESPGCGDAPVGQT